MSSEEASDSTEDEEMDSNDDEDTIAEVLNRDCEDGGGLLYEVRMINNEEAAWWSREDLWDDGNNSKKIEAYDFRNPVDWDDVCQFCGASFEGPETGCSGCPECRCDECGIPCRHFNGINYGCPLHPVV